MVVFRLREILDQIDFLDYDQFHLTVHTFVPVLLGLGHFGFGNFRSYDSYLHDNPDIVTHHMKHKMVLIETGLYCLVRLGPNCPNEQLTGWGHTDR